MKSDADDSASFEELEKQYKEKHSDFRKLQVQKMKHEFKMFFSKDLDFTIKDEKKSVSAVYSKLNRSIVLTENEDTYSGMALAVYLKITTMNGNEYKLCCDISHNFKRLYSQSTPAENKQHTIEYYKAFINGEIAFTIKYCNSSTKDKKSYSTFTELLEAID